MMQATLPLSPPPTLTSDSFVQDDVFIFFGLSEDIRADQKSLSLSFKKKSQDRLLSLIEKVKEAGKTARLVLAGEWRQKASLEQFQAHWKQVSSPNFFEEKLAPFVCGQTDSKLQEHLAVEAWLKKHDLKKSETNYVVISGVDKLQKEKKTSFGNRYIWTLNRHFDLSALDLAKKQIGIS